MKITQPCAFFVKNQEELETVIGLISNDNVWDYFPKDTTYQWLVESLEQIEGIKADVVYLFVGHLDSKNWELYFGSEQDFKDDTLPLVEWRT